MVTRFPRPSAWPPAWPMERYRWHARVSLVCSAVGSGSPPAILLVHSLVSIGRHFTDPHEASSARLWQPFLGAWQAEQSTNTAFYSCTSHFYLFELIYCVVKAILFVESQRAIWELKHVQYERWYCTVGGAHKIRDLQEARCLWFRPLIYFNEIYYSANFIAVVIFHA